MRDAASAVLTQRVAKEGGIARGTLASIFLHAGLVVGALPFLAAAREPRMPSGPDTRIAMFDTNGSGSIGGPKPSRDDRRVLQKPPSSETRRVDRDLPVPPREPAVGASMDAVPLRAGTGSDLGVSVEPGDDGNAEGDWYLAGVRRRIRGAWMPPAGANPEVVVAFTIHTDGVVTDVHVAESSGNTLIDRAAQRAILVAAPFSPLIAPHLPGPIVVRAVFHP
jgi:TonB family protein